MNAGMWDEWAEMSIAHRDPVDADVAQVLAVCRHDSELERLRDLHRDLVSLWEPL